METIVWSKPMCPFCDKAKALLKKKGINFEERLLGSDWTKEQLLEAVPTARSVPQVFLKGEYIGGFNELEKHFGDL